MYFYSIFGGWMAKTPVIYTLSHKVKLKSNLTEISIQWEEESQVHLKHTTY